MGDSARGGIAIALPQWLRNEEIEQPSNIILFSPWLDVTMTNPEISKLVSAPAMTNNNAFSLELQVLELRKRGELYAGKKESSNYMVRPIYGIFEGLAPITLFVRTTDLFANDCQKFKAKAEEEGVTLDYREFGE